MSQDRKLMKVMSIILLFWALLIFVYDAICITVVAQNGWQWQGIVLVALYSFQGFFGISCGMAGVRGANAPSRANTYNIQAAILGIYELISLIYTIVVQADFGGRPLGSDIPSLVLTMVPLIVCIAGWILGRRVFEASKK